MSILLAIYNIKDRFMDNKIIWIVNKDAAPTAEYATHIRSTREAAFFLSKGYEVKIICGNRVHNTNIVHPVKGKYSVEIHDGVEYVFVKTIAYKNSFIKRVLSYSAFSLKIFLLNELGKPDIVIHDTKTPFDMLVSTFAKKNNAKYIVDVEDLWPRMFEFMGFLKPNNPILKLLYNLEKRLYAKADHVVFTMEGGGDYIKDHKWDMGQKGPIALEKVHYVNNGIVLKDFDYNRENYRIKDVDLEDDSLFRVIYLGSIRQANNLGQLIDAAKRLLAYENIKILIYGDGPERKTLEERCLEENINNVVFKQKWIEPKYVPYVLSKAHINILNYSLGWARYGGSMNKMFMSFASGKPMVCNANLSYSEIKRHNLGIDEYLDTPDKYANAILSIFNMPKLEYEKMCLRTREVAKTYDVPVLMENFARFCQL